METALIGEVRPQNKPVCRCHLEAQARKAAENRSRKMGGDSAAVLPSRESRCRGSVEAQHRRLGEKRSRKRDVLEPLVFGRGVASIHLSEAPDVVLGKGVSCRPERARKP